MASLMKVQQYGCQKRELEHSDIQEDGTADMQAKESDAISALFFTS